MFTRKTLFFQNGYVALVCMKAGHLYSRSLTTEQQHEFVTVNWPTEAGIALALTRSQWKLLTEMFLRLLSTPTPGCEEVEAAMRSLVVDYALATFNEPAISYFEQA